jgi:integrase
MSELHSTPSAVADKPAKPNKPYPEFPLTAHPAGYWCKKIRGKIYYFGPWSDPDGALTKYLAEKDALHAGRAPRPEPEALTVKALVNAFLNHKAAHRDGGELSARTWSEYKDTCDLLISRFGKGRLVEDLSPEDFAGLREHMAKRWGPVRLGNVIQMVRGVFKFASENDLMARPVRYGQGFDRPSAKVLRLHRAKNGERMLEAAEVQRVLDALAGKEVETGGTDERTGKLETVTLQPNPALRAMILLGVNCGLGNHDCALLPLSALDLDGGWLNFPRPKTGIPRRCPLWPETVAALREAIAGRTAPRQEEAAGLVFVTTRGRPWLSRGIANPVSVAVRDVMKAVGIHHDGIGFYTLRHVFRTIADAARDPVAIDLIMGHTDPSMAGHYRERVEDSRLKAVANVVRAWLFPTAQQ